MENINIKLYRNTDNILMTLYRKEVYNYPYNKGGGFDENWIWFRYINKCNLEITGKIVYSMLDNANIFSNIKEHTKLLISLNLTIKGNGKYYIKDSGVSYEVKKINFINEEFIKKTAKICNSFNDITNKMINEEYINNFKEAENMFKICFGV